MMFRLFFPDKAKPDDATNCKAIKKSAAFRETCSLEQADFCRCDRSTPRSRAANEEKPRDANKARRLFRRSARRARAAFMPF